LTEPIFDRAERERLEAHYPSAPVSVRHRLADHPLLEIEALMSLARRMDPDHMRSNLGDLPIEVDPEGVHRATPDAAETIRSIEENGSWMVLRHIQTVPEYGALVDSIAAELAPIAAATTGRMLNVDGLIFIASPGAVTPFHFDPEHNVLMQLRGSKTISIFPAFDESVVSEQSHESLHLNGHMNLPWRDEMTILGRTFDLSPGDAVSLPFKAPHWVKNGTGVSVSLSVTWQSEWGYAEADARMMNIALRRWGMTPRALRPYPARNRAKSIAWRAIRRVRGIARPATAD
jgi:hypothetical protein